MNYKVCSKCKKELPMTLEFFHKRDNVVDGFASWCIECVNEKSRNYYWKNHEYESKRGQRYRKDNPAQAMMVWVRCRADRKKLEFNLTKEWIQERLDKGICEVTGLKFKRILGKKGPSPFTPSIDRVDPSKGYTQDNCQITVWIYNVAKQNWNNETLFTFCKAFVNKIEEGGNEENG